MRIQNHGRPLPAQPRTEPPRSTVSNELAYGTSGDSTFTPGAAAPSARPAPSGPSSCPELPPSLAALGRSAAWAKLPAHERRQVAAIVKGGASNYALQMLLSLEDLQGSADFNVGSSATQSKLLKEAIAKGVPPDVEELQTSPAPVAYRMGHPTLEKNHSFPGKSADADVFPLQIDGRSIPVYVPHDGQYHPPVQLPIDEVAQAIAELPPESRARVKTVSVNPVPSPMDAYWAKQYNMPDFASWMTCGPEGGVDIFPANSQQPENAVVSSLIHETGHAWSVSGWGENDAGPRWQPWEKAIKLDGPLPPSQYAQSSPEEDVAESTALYLSTRGTPAFNEFRAMFPHRFALLDAQFGGKA